MSRPTMDEVRALLDYAQRWSEDGDAVDVGRSQTIIALCEAEIERRTLRFKPSMIQHNTEILIDHDDNRRGLARWMGGSDFWSYGSDRGEATTYKEARDHVEAQARAEGLEVAT